MMHRRTGILLIAQIVAILFAVSVLLFDFGFFEEEASSTVPETSITEYVAQVDRNQLTRGTVTKVTDGDTVRVEIDGEEQKVRLIGIDTPEVFGGKECYGEEASNVSKQLLEGRTVYLQKDISETDDFGRLLRYVYVEQEGNLLDFNAFLVGEGYAFSAVYEPDTARSEYFNLVMQEAQEDDTGIWSTCEVSVNDYGRFESVRV
jgi:micrococcal nuclease